MSNWISITRRPEEYKNSFLLQHGNKQRILLQQLLYELSTHRKKNGRKSVNPLHLPQFHKSISSPIKLTNRPQYSFLSQNLVTSKDCQTKSVLLPPPLPKERVITYIPYEIVLII